MKRKKTISKTARPAKKSPTAQDLLDALARVHALEARIIALEARQPAQTPQFWTFPPITTGAMGNVRFVRWQEKTT